MRTRTYIIIIITAIFAITGLFLLTNVSGLNKEISDSFNLVNKFDSKKSIFLNNTRDSDSFEGVIEIMEKRSYDTISFLLTIKQNIVKLDKNIKNGKPEESLIFDLDKETITALHHNKKMFCSVPVSNYNKNYSSDFKIKKTNNKKKIAGYSCNQWRVKNSREDTEITFWVVGKRFNFYQKFIQLWNKTDNCYQYFLTIPEADGYMPMQQVERTLLRDVKYSIIVEQISE